MAAEITKGIRVVTKDGHLGTVENEPALTASGHVVTVKFDDPSISAGGGAGYDVNDLKPAPADEEHPCECSAYDALDPEELTDERLANGDYEVFTTGCTATTRRTFAPGHDAKLKSFLIRHGAAGHEIRRSEAGVASSASAEEHAARYAFARMVTAGVQRAEAKAAEKAARAEERAARKTAPRARRPKKVTAKVGRATFTGRMDGEHFVYEVKGKERRTLKFVAV
ncbi:hypothetical protein GCM10010145_11980 [Streptomyces ruber]|uniref:Uncharacterized protein n=2 Tax=Streptomyces TaxID=1883 RepID=A0A918B8C4_9ACTN|nr:hypothetical protein [Streptomyces ruber]GGQ44913.1 hypothetical protein GCM10010145_11980 [Streptomyces ruber]